MAFPPAFLDELVRAELAKVNGCLLELDICFLLCSRCKCEHYCERK